MKRMLIFCLTLLVLLPSCSDQNIPEDFSQEESAFRDETSDTMESQAPLNQQEIRFDPERVLPGNPENYHVGAFDGDSIIYYVVEGTHFDVYSYDTKTGQTGKIGSIDNYTTYSRPMRFVALNGKYYFSIGCGDTYEDSESNVMQFTMEENSLTSCDSQYLSTKSVILKQYMGQIAQRKTTYENGKEISYIELYDVKTNQKSRFLSKDVKSEGGFTTIPNFAVSGEDLYLLVQKYTPIYDENNTIMDLEWTSWTIEKYHSDGELVGSFPCDDAKEYFLANIITQFCVWGDYVYFACGEEAAIYKMEDGTARLVLKSTTLPTFYPSGNSQEEEIASVLFSAYSQQFYLFDFEKGELKILDCPMNNGEKIYSCFRSGDNICYETWDGGDLFRCYLTTMDDLMALEARSLDLSSGLLDLASLTQ